MDVQDVMYGSIGLLVIGCLVGYYFLSRALAQTNQVLVVWEQVAETPILGNYVASIFTMLMKIRNPYSRSIRTAPFPLRVSLTADFQITSLEVGRCRGILKRRWNSDGPFHCTHGVALTLFAETLAGLAVFSRLGQKGKGILLKTETEYLKKAKGTEVST